MLGSLFEDLHWLLLLSGHTVAMDSEGETAVIPSELVQHSIAQAKTVNIETTLKVISSFIDWCILSLELLLFYLRTGKL